MVVIFLMLITLLKLILATLIGYIEYLKGHCHAIWQLYRKLEGVFSSFFLLRNNNKKKRCENTF